MEKIKCYFCGDEATQKEKSDSSFGLNVSCPRCGRYELTDPVIRFYLKRENKKQILNQEDKENLSLHVQKEYDPNDGKPVVIDTKVIKKVTGKESKETKY